MAESYSPSKGMVSEAKLGLKWRKEFGRGGTAVGVARARDIANGKQLPLDTVRRMHSYFSRHEVDKKGAGFRPGAPEYPSAGRIAWALWGGDAGQRWAAAIVNRNREEVVSMEVRNHIEDVEFRSEGGRLIAQGYAARFDALSQNLGGFVEQIAPGAFTKTLQEADVRALFNHDPNFVLGRNKSGTLRMAEDRDGLAYEIDLPDTTLGRDVAVLLERGDISGSSFGFRVIEDDWAETRSGFPLRTLKQVALRDVGPVTYPAYVDSSSALRSFAEARSLDIDTVVAAAEENKLAELCAHCGVEAVEVEQVQEDDRGDNLIIVHRSPLTY
jgi:HK97 family phage prohead protease